MIRPETPLITVVPAMNMVEVTAPDGTPMQEPITPKRTELNTKLAVGSLAAFYIAKGPGAHSIAELAIVENKSRMGTHAAIKNLTSMLPKEIITTEGKTRIPLGLGDLDPARVIFSDQEREQMFTVAERVILGPVRIASRKPTEAEQAVLDSAAQEAAVAKAARQEAAKLAIEEADASKQNLTHYDHAIVDVRGYKFHLPFESRSAMVAARVFKILSALDEKEAKRYFSVTTISQRVWKDMSLDERRLYCKDEDSIYKRSNSVTKSDVNEVLSNLTHRLGTTRRGPSRDEYRVAIKPADITVTYDEMPLGEQQAETAITVFPPGTAKARLTAGPEAITGEDAAQAELIIAQYLASDRFISHPACIDTLDFIMDAKGKRALRLVLEQRGTPEAFKDTLKGIHRTLWYNLGGPAYWSATRARMIKGYSVKGSTAGVRFVGGSPPTTTKWHVGMNEDASQAFRARLNE